MNRETILLLGYLTNEDGSVDRPVIGMPFLSSTLNITRHADQANYYDEIENRLGLKEEETPSNDVPAKSFAAKSSGATIIYDCKVKIVPKRGGHIPKQFALVVVKPGMRERVRESLKGGIVWVSTGDLIEYLEEMRRKRARLYRTFIMNAEHDSMGVFVDVLKTSEVGL